VLQRHWGKIPERKLFLKALWNWHKEIPQGFMTGSIDLLFRVKNRFYILDWKSNALNGNPDAFNKEGIQEEMARYVYFLQYLIYTVAIHNYLKNRLPDYDYERNFGGVYYLFVRGIDPSVPGRGIYFDRPTMSLIEDLSETLGEFNNDSRA
jgi:exodeoxyribonuclease V beta subunit